MSAHTLGFPDCDNEAESSGFYMGYSVSPAGQIIATICKDIAVAIRQSVSLIPDRSKCVDTLLDVFHEASTVNWDGEGAKQVTGNTVKMAWKFVRTLPHYIPDPEISADPDGDIAMDWIKDRGHMLSVSIRDNGEINYAGIFGRSKLHGSDAFDEKIPAIITEAIERVFL